MWSGRLQSPAVVAKNGSQTLAPCALVQGDCAGGQAEVASRLSELPAVTQASVCGFSNAPRAPWVCVARSPTHVPAVRIPLGFWAETLIFESLELKDSWKMSSVNK